MKHSFYAGLVYGFMLGVGMTILLVTILGELK